ncbi:6-phospho-beta-glucosidase [Peribacillus alkalitolerans]|uniref:6-phospho-beta-glucosidase n=1 Tax=Peribacillus alkalitolerans TaxID=1550385 RepID=UPI0013D262F4|nr:6-phospho-beta-glucosidase [Peribacillus alkalitolerans]
MTTNLKIAVIGGGSSYTPELIEGFIKRYKELPVEDIWLVDIHEGQEKLETIAKLSQRMVNHANLPITIHRTFNREEALKNAQFVITQMRVGMLDARIKDERIPLQHGMIGQETNGAGGLFKGLRTIPVLLEIAEEMEQLCPEAWLINFTNPAGMVTEALLRYSNHKKIVGVCNLPYHTTVSIAKLLGVPKEDVYIQFAGLNHLVHGLSVMVNGEDKTELVIELLSNPDIQLTMRNIAPLPWQPDFMKSMGVILCPYHRYYFKSKEILDEELLAFQSGTTRAEVVKRLEADLFELYKEENLAIKPPQLEKRGGAYYSDAACNLISSIYSDKGDIQTLNVRNNGAISSLSAHSAVEVNCVVTKNGPIPLAVGELPVQVNGLVQQIKSFEVVAAEAAVTGSYEKALLALCINPLVPSDELAKKVLDDLLNAHKEYLPRFFKGQKEASFS